MKHFLLTRTILVYGVLSPFGATVHASVNILYRNDSLLAEELKATGLQMKQLHKTIKRLEVALKQHPTLIPELNHFDLLSDLLMRDGSTLIQMGTLLNAHDNRHSLRAFVTSNAFALGSADSPTAWRAFVMEKPNNVPVSPVDFTRERNIINTDIVPQAQEVNPAPPEPQSTAEEVIGSVPEAPQLTDEDLEKPVPKALPRYLPLSSATRPAEPRPTIRPAGPRAGVTPPVLPPNFAQQLKERRKQLHSGRPPVRKDPSRSQQQPKSLQEHLKEKIDERRQNVADDELDPNLEADVWD